MALFVTSLNTGSNGNCFYVGNDNEAILIDAGISCKEIEKRMKRLDLSMYKVKAIFVTHEHTDHISGIPVLSKKYQLPVFITQHTLRDSRMDLQPTLVHSFKSNKSVSIGNLSIFPFRKSHDACDPHSFVVSHDHIKVGVFTDIGYSCREVIQHFQQCHAVFLESNYCDTMLTNGSYPYYLKKRISSDHGHLSNKQALELFLNYRGNALSHLFLSHLSKNNNTPEVVEELFKPHAGTTNIIVASRYYETPVYSINPGLPVEPRLKLLRKTEHVQLSLFDSLQ